jgi:hypothetical protein
MLMSGTSKSADRKESPRPAIAYATPMSVPEACRTQRIMLRRAIAMAMLHHSELQSAIAKAASISFDAFFLFQ